jgi:FKBP-type peptidyl-prolyl cis-trans isomerase
MNSGTEDYPNFWEQLEKDLQAIDDYLAQNNIQGVQKDADGLIRYVVHRDSVGTGKPTIDSCATVNYAGFLMANGSKFDDGNNFSFPVAGVIDGWKIGIPLLDLGDSVTFYIPSGLGYGYAGYEPDIPRNANLIFRVALKDIGKTYNSSSRSCQ